MQISIGTSLALPRFIAVADSGGGDVTWTNPDLADAFYEYVSFSVTTQESTPAGVIFKDDGTKMYIIGTNADAVLQYGLSTAWDLSTVSYDTVSADVSGQEDAPRSVFFKDDGTSFYIVGSTNDTVYQYDMTTAWDLNTASYVSKSASVSGQETSPRCVRFKSDGTSFYVTGTSSDSISQYDMTTAWDVSTASYASKQLDVSAQELSPFTFDFSPNGDKVWLVGGNDTVREYTLSTAWDISTGSHESSVSFTTSNEDATAISITFKSDGSKMYLLGAGTDKVYQYSTVNLGWTNPDIPNASYDSKSLDTSTEDTVPRNIVFNTDGTKLFMVGPVSDSVHEYDLSTAWDVSTGTINQSESLAAQDPIPIALFFKPDGTKMYMGGASLDKIYEYDLSTAFDISTLSLNQSQSISAQQSAISGLFFNSTGTKLIVSGTDSVQLDEYTLSTPWDISTETHNRSATLSEMTYAMSVQLSPKGDKLWVIANIPDEVYEYNLTTPFDLSTIAYSNNKFDIGTQAANGLGLAFKTDGSKMYIANSSTSEIFQYST